MASCEVNPNDPITPCEIAIALLAAAWLVVGPIIALKVGGIL